ncbi:protein kinase family protein [Nocardioides daeguensis]|uniref:non-specific serine/threonine protein kinase n=1 Tax=Nocardioides daeguensis TaxID=908359 RepID=A0ABP6WD06_9ACTN|nr:protein kinase family protein [Nocardioides daeguensis]MBV6728115.1 protein kinase family protein [Nocardioides daeguensis]MCR1774189.1 protein kinase family protein [Nocardioides daeguensis]
MATSTRSGDVLAGRYRLIDLLSESGGGRFWRAHDRVLERFVALHVIDQDDARARDLVEAARTSARVLDPRILRVLDAEEEDGRCFVVNEWGTGISLDILVTHDGPLSPRNAAWLVADIADALARAHAAGVTHGRLNPENVLIDRYGAVRIIGMCVDAALHGLSPGDVQGDLEDLGGLLHCALTATWPGPSGSIVPAAPRENDTTLSPRQVVAGVPQPLDVLWRELDQRSAAPRWRRRGADHPDVSSAASIAAELLAFVGDPTGMPEKLARAIPPINELRPVWLPAMADPLPHDASRDDIPVVPAAPEPEPEPASEPEPEREPAPEDTGPPIPLVSELPTEAGMPVFGDEDVTWLRTRSTPPPPPPPFEELPERPLFAPDPPDGVRRRLPPVPAEPAPGGPPPGATPTGFWPWDTDTGPGDPSATGEVETVPGRSWLRLAMAVGLAVLLLVAVAIAFNLGRGRTVLGGDPERTPSTAETTSGRAGAIKGVVASAIDPLGTDGEENQALSGNVVDGDPRTSWRTETYYDQLGPTGIKTGVGLVLDLGRARTVAGVEVRMVDEGVMGPNRVGLYPVAGTTAPAQAPTGTPVATDTGGGRLTLTPGEPVAARYLVLWWTALPEVGSDFRAEVSEVVVRGG